MTELNDPWLLRLFALCAAVIVLRMAVGLAVVIGLNIRKRCRAVR